MWCNFWSKCSLFLSSTLNISYILSYIFWKNPLNGNVSTTYLTNSTKRNTHASASLHIFLESNYKLVPWLKKFEKVFSSSFVCGSSAISVLKVQCGSERNISISNQNSTAKTPFTHFISLRRWVFFFPCLLN